MTYTATASIVTFHNPERMVARAIQSFLGARGSIRLYVVDNSSDGCLRRLCTDERVQYIHTGRNLGFGAAHNIAMRQALEQSPTHFILNPDIYCEPATFDALSAYLGAHPRVGLVMPGIRYPDGALQRLCKLIPTPVDLIGRRFLGGTRWADAQRRRYELHDADYDAVMKVPVLSGCFLAARTAALAETGLFDERFFMYLEDVDLCRRIGRSWDTVYYPHVTAHHEYGQGSYRNWRLLRYHTRSAVQYFNKWGWFRDRSRSVINAEALARLLPDGRRDESRTSTPCLSSEEPRS